MLSLNYVLSGIKKFFSIPKPIVSGKFLLGFMIGLLLSPAILGLTQQLCYTEPYNYGMEFEQYENFDSRLDHRIAELDSLTERLEARRFPCEGEGCITDIRKLAATLRTEANRHDLPVEIVERVLYIENPWYDTTAVSYAGAVGLMQVIPRYHEGRFEHCPENLYSVKGSLCTGSAILDEYLDRQYRNAVSRALLSYNGCTREECSSYARIVMEGYDFGTVLMD